DLAVSLWPRHRAHAQQLWLPGGQTDASGAAGLARFGAGAAGLAAEADPQADLDVGDLSDVVPRQPAGAGQGPGERSDLAVRHAPAGGRRDPRLDPGGQWQPEPEDRGAERLSGDTKGSAGGAVDAWLRVGQVDSGGAVPAQRLCLRQAL